ncbi:heavy-metal-associated domain-containing protein [uncultured Parasphingorhabdus sp.]|uniref:heavy-metal-associated domain-containing protein n=1 Tax=uncultured Parasphingorhabdus sp. TaxID=2709694 RepID=UPI0030D7C2C2|tara:strand:- start:53752 stop:55038 length:1287 start_codon:yes stop_codon:yes gene_type:complete
MSILTDFRIKIAAIIAAVMMLAVAVVYAQLDGTERGVAPLASTGDFEVMGVKVDVHGDNAFDARKKGWEEAQRLAWKMLYKSTQGGESAGLPDGTLNTIVSAIVVEQEQIGPKRYIATLGVMFDRARAGSILGVSGRRLRSPPMLVLPIMWSGGSAQVFESRTEWQKAWARFRSGESAIDYVRPYGSDSESLVLTAGQANRPSRRWWRNILDQFGAADVVIPIVRLTYMYPGGPVKARFTARYGPDNKYIGSFSLKVDRSEDIPKMLDQGIVKLDNIYASALARGILKTDKSLIVEDPFNLDDLDLADFDLGDDVADEVGVSEAAASVATTTTSETAGEAPGAGPAATTSVSLQFDTPDVGAVGRGESSVRAIPGVASASTSSLALGGVSVMSVTYRGDIAALAQALRSQGWQVQQGAGTLRISRSGQ